MHEKKLEMLLWLKKACRAATTFGFTTSAIGNVLHAPHTPFGIGISLVAPTFLFVAFEIVTRIPMDPDRSWWFKILRVVGTASIAAITAILSYFHQRDAIFLHSEGDQLAAYLLPLAIDGLMIVGSVSLIELGFQIQKVEAYIAAGNRVVKTQEPEIPLQKERGPNGRERVMAVLAKDPIVTIKVLAQRAGVSEGYASTLAKELRSLNGAELIDVN